MFEFFKLLDTNRKRKFYLMSAFILFGMLLDIFSLTLLVPLIEIIIQDNQSFITSIIVDFLEKNNFESILLPFSLLVIFVFVVKSLYSIYLTFRQNRFISNMIRDTSNKLFSYYIQQDYNFYLKINSAEVIRGLNSDLHQFSSYLRSTLFLITEIGFVSSTIGLLIFLNPLISVGTLAFFSSMVFIYYKVLKRKLTYLGAYKQQIGLRYNKSILESMNSIKEIKVNKKEPYFKDVMSKLTFSLWAIDAKHNTYIQIPRYILELISIVAIFVMIFILSLNSNSAGSLISFLGVFVASIFKILPSANKILNSLQDLKFSKSVVFSIQNQLKELKSTITLPKTVKKFMSLELKEISFGYLNETLLENIDLKLTIADFIGIKGESGTGKTTLVDIILGLQKPKNGVVSVNGKAHYDFKKGYLPQSCSILDTTIANNIAFGVPEKNQDESKILDALKKAELFNFIAQKKEGINFMVGEAGARLSGGQKQRLGLARALYNDPDILILDEPTSALDAKTEQAILKTLQKISKSTSIILISHNESLLNGCKKVYHLTDRKLVKC